MNPIHLSRRLTFHREIPAEQLSTHVRKEGTTFLRALDISSFPRLIDHFINHFSIKGVAKCDAGRRDVLMPDGTGWEFMNVSNGKIPDEISEGVEVVGVEM